MPYEIKKRGAEFCVMKQGTMESMGCHPTMDKAKRHMAALYANVPDAMMKATADINDLPDSDFAYIEPGGHKDSTGRTVPRSLRHFPIHDAAHVRAALARLSQSPFGDKARAKVEAAARRMGIGDYGKAMPVKATVLDDDRFRLLAIPFGGPIPRSGTPRGVDLDGEWFSERTDIKGDWLPFRPVDWHHGGDATLGRTVIGKADHLVMDEEGWWVDVWLKHGERRLDLIRRLAEQAAQTGKAAIFGSSESIGGFIRKAATGEILVWPYWRQTLSTSPQNTLSVIRPLKATLDDLMDEGQSPSAAFWSDIEVAMRDLGDDLRATSRGELGAKAGRVLRADNERDLRAALAALEEAMARAQAVLGRQPDYSPQEDT